MSLVFLTGDIYIFFFFGNGFIDDVIVIGWTDSDFKISRALGWGYPYTEIDRVGKLEAGFYSFNFQNFHNIVINHNLSKIKKKNMVVE